MKALNLMSFDQHFHLVHPEEFSHLTQDSSALAIFTDFKKHIPQAVVFNMPAMHAESMMRKAHVRLKVVLDKEGELVGTISVNELEEQKMFQVQQENGISKEEILVQDLMIPRHKIKALEYDELAQSSIGDVLETLNQNHQQHCLVVDTDEKQIRGVISASDIARRLHIPLPTERKTTFFDIFMALRPS